MGLDMYLDKVKIKNDATLKDIKLIDDYLDWKNGYADKYSFLDWTERYDESDVDMNLVNIYKDEYIDRYSYWDTEKKYAHKSIFECVGYWRKANQIHNWMVNNVQSGIDDCGTYIVEEIKLRELLDICELIKNTSILKDGKVKNGEIWTSDGHEILYKDGELIVNSEIAMELLPTTSGFFFGSTDYDQWYIADIDNTIEILTNVLNTTDFNNEIIIYSSSW